MIEQIKVNNLIKKLLNKILITSKINFIDEIKIPQNLCASLLYPTNDFLLTEKQFNALIESCQNDLIYLIQIGYEGDFLSDNNKVFVLKRPYKFEEYNELFLDTLTIIFSSEGKWFLVIDESVEGGEGILIGDADIIKKFEEEYKDSKNNLLEFVNFQLEDFKKRKHIDSVNHLKNIIDKLML